MALRQHRETVVVPAARGTIFDRNGEPLAIGEQATTVYANPRQVDAPARSDAGRRQGARRRARRSSTRSSSTARGASSTSRGRPIRSRPRRSRSAASPGSASTPRSCATYPQGPVAAQVLGFAGLDNKGLDGLERSLEKALAGRPGSQTIVKDPFGRALDVVSTKPERPARTSGSRSTTRSRRTPRRCSRDTVRRWGARAATAVVMDPHTGAVLAMAVAPRFNANRFSDDPRRSPPQPRRHRHVRAGLDLQARHRRGALEEQHRDPADVSSRWRPRSRSPTA